MEEQVMNPPDNATRMKLLVAGAALLGIFGWFFMSVVDSGVGVMQYYHTLSEFEGAVGSGQAKAESTALRLNGFVKDGSIQRDVEQIAIDFVMTDGTADLPVHIARLDVSDLFKDGANVVVEGQLGENGVFYADNLTAKCPTKYQAAEDAQQAAVDAHVPAEPSL